MVQLISELRSFVEEPSESKDILLLQAEAHSGNLTIDPSQEEIDGKMLKSTRVFELMEKYCGLDD